MLEKHLSYTHACAVSSVHVWQTYERCSGKITVSVMEGESNDLAYINTRTCTLKHTISHQGKSKYLFTAPWSAAFQLMRSINTFR